MSDQPQPPPTTPYMPPFQPAPPTAPLRTGMAVTALVFGIVGVFTCPVFGILAIILGIVALNRTTREPQTYGGRGMAIAGIATGGAGMVLNVMWVALLISILLPSYSRATELSKRIVCAANMKGIGTTLKIYTIDYPDQGLPTPQLLVDLGYVMPEQIVCPSSSDEPGDCSYILVPNAQMSLESGANTVILYEPLENHGDEGGNFLFADGHVTFERKEAYKELVQSIQRGGP
jgi:prepilin-type processing-associated H-X9-DG protein